ncbi:hypoxanthine phosphoribosyltransferase [Limnochorda pilosa]|uniref:Hypoxanthine phosphoribosyltransferase n=1 Tax=Limnochorda pilosa TaxID=1555112 RepID=A0A0K2SHR7_LIMPI|nr:hypoxanthine phosphoribosyltransferase [Limnochorda pilosa]
MPSDRPVHITRPEVEARIGALGKEISRDYADGRLVVAAVLRGAVYFAVDLTRRLSVPFTLDFLAISRFGGTARPHGVVRITKDLDENIYGRDVLLLEDIVDTGLSLSYLLRTLAAREPASLKVCTLLDAPGRRIVDVPVEYVGFRIPDQFVVGWGLDAGQSHRGEMAIRAVQPE